MADLVRACPAECPARASRHHWPGKGQESCTSQASLWSVLLFSDPTSLMALAAWVLDIVVEKVELSSRHAEVCRSGDLDQPFSGDFSQVILIRWRS